MLRDAMQDLVNTIISSQQERREFLARNRRETQRLLETTNRSRKASSREADRDASMLVESLQSANRANRTAVARQLREIRYQRVSQSKKMRIVLTQGVERNRRAVSRALQENNSSRARATRLRTRETTKTLKSIKNEVHQIRKASNQLTTRIATDLRASRRAWAMLSTASGK